MPQIPETIVVVPAGRRRYMRLLVPHLLANRTLLTRCDLWVNTTDAEDLAYLEGLERNHPGFFRLVMSSVPVCGNHSISCFYGNEYRSPGTIYVKIDDDIIWMKDDALACLLEFRKNNPQYFLVYANTWNNQICDHLNQRAGLLPAEPCIEWSCGGSLWKSGRLAEMVQRELILRLKSGGIRGWVPYERWELRKNERCSINLISWLGEDFADLSPEGLDAPLGGGDDEYFLSCIAPERIGKANVICGAAIAAHFSYYPQRDYLDSTDLLQIWSKYGPGVGI